MNYGTPMVFHLRLGDPLADSPAIQAVSENVGRSFSSTLIVVV